MVVHNTVPGIALLRTILTKQSRKLLPGYTRMLHTVPKVVTLFIWWRTAQSLWLLLSFELAGPDNSPQGCLQPYSYGGAQHSLWHCCRSSKHVEQTTVPVTITGGGNAVDRNFLPEFHNIGSMLQRARQKMRPPIPTDIDDVVIDDIWAETWSAEQYLFHLDND